jgi:uncharacterized SAM-binding protein YcdF (DUF218 family)
MENILYFFKIAIQTPIFWLLISIFLSIICYFYFQPKVFTFSVVMCVFWLFSLTPLGASLWLGSLTLLNTRVDGDCSKNKILSSAILLPGGLSWLAENGGEKLSDWSIERANVVVELSRKGVLDQVVLPGGLGSGINSEAELLKKYLKNIIDIKRYVIAGKSDTTFENIKTLMPLLNKQHPYYLVTSYWHMPRAKRVADKLSLITCPMMTINKISWSLIPSFEAHWHTKAAIHEWLGLAWYRIKGKI